MILDDTLALDSDIALLAVMASAQEDRPPTITVADVVDAVQLFRAPVSTGDFHAGF